MYDLSPFDRTLYVDADTEFKQPIQAGFALLEQYDIMYARHSWHTLAMLDMMPGTERQITIDELHTGDIPYPNSGVIFWKRGSAAEKVFQSWYTEWKRFEQWDEQCALMRAVYKNPCRLLLLPEAWNGENQKEGAIIFHDFHGQRVARMDASEVV